MRKTEYARILRGESDRLNVILMNREATEMFLEGIRRVDWKKVGALSVRGMWFCFGLALMALRYDKELGNKIAILTAIFCFIRLASIWFKEGSK